MATATFSFSFTLWSNAGKHEWIVYNGDTVLNRSGLVFNNRAAAKRSLEKFAAKVQAAVQGQIDDRILAELAA